MSAPKPSLRKAGFARRKAVTVSAESLVRIEALEAGGELPLVIRPSGPKVKLAAWAEGHRDLLDRHLQKHGAILFRGFDLPAPESFEAAVRAMAGELLEYKERSSPRSQVKGQIYTSTDYPADQPIFLHNENSYQNIWPMRICFFCHTPAEQGGETPLADVRKIFRRLSPETRQRFAEKKWSYVRNFGAGFGLSWKTVFRTEDKAEVEAYCRANAIEFEWLKGDQLRTRAVRRAAMEHPETGEMVWFNHATFFHVSTLPETIRESLHQEFDEQHLPSNTYYGDGEPIEPEILDELRSIYRSETVSFPWQKGDLLMLDNMKVAHAREPYEGERRVLVAMAQPCHRQRFEASRSDP